MHNVIDFYLKTSIYETSSSKITAVIYDKQYIPDKVSISKETMTSEALKE
jgi:hypothetical protein